MKGFSKILSFVLAMVLFLSTFPLGSFTVTAKTDYSDSKYSVNFMFSSCSGGTCPKSEISFRQDQAPIMLSHLMELCEISGTPTLSGDNAPRINRYYSESKDKGKVSFVISGGDCEIKVSDTLSGYVEIKFNVNYVVYTVRITTTTGKNTPATDSDGHKVYICGAAREETYPLRVSQLLEIKTEGFDADDTFTYKIKLTNTDTSISSGNCYLHYFSSSDMSTSSGKQISMDSYFSNADKYFALVDASNKYHQTSKVEVQVYSSKTKKTFTCSYENFDNANLEEDCKNANFIMFEGESFTLRQLFGLSGITHITCEKCYTDNVTLEGSSTVLENNIVKIESAGTYTADSVKRTNYKVTAKKEGKTYATIDVHKLGTSSASCDHHTGQYAGTNTKIWVIKKPVFIDNEDGTITVTNITKDVNYTINGITLKAGDDPTLLFPTKGTVCRLTAEDGDAFLFRDFPIVLTEKHKHNWSYAVKTDATDTLVATCSGTGICDNTLPTEITILPPSDLTYDKNEKLATLNQTAFAGQTSVPTIQYYSGDTLLDNPPKEPGKYTAKITVGGATASTSFEIVKTSYPITYTNDGKGTISGKTTATEDETISLTTTPNDGYEVDEIKVNGNKITGTSFIMPNKATTVDVKFKAKTNTAYKVNVYVMGTDGKYPTSYTKQYDYTGTTDTTADISTKISGYCTDAGSATAFSLDTNKTNVLSGNIAGDGSLVLTVYLKRAQYTLTVNKGTGINTVSGAGTYYFDEAISPSATSLTGYGTPSWDKTVPAKMPANDLTIEASATPNTNTAYKVNVYVMGTDGTYPTQYTKQYDYTGTTDTNVDISSNISGYCTDAGSATAFSKDTNKTNVVSGKIAGDGSLVLTVYLKRAKYTLTLNKGTGINTVSGAGSYYFDEAISPAATSLTGYGTPSWDKAAPAKMPANDLTLEASANPNTNTVYKVNVFVMGTDGTYPTQYTKQYDYTGTTDTNVDINSNISGYCTDAGSSVAFSLDTAKGNTLTGKIAGDGSLVLTVYLKRAQYTLTLNKGTGIDSVSGAGTYYYDAPIAPSATALKGYGTPSWDKTVPAKMPAENLELTALAEAESVGYKVNVFVMGTDGNYPTSYTKQYSYNGTANAAVNISSNISGYCIDAGQATAFSLDTNKTNVLSGNIKGDGTLVLTVYLKRAQYTLTLNKGTGIDSVTGAGKYYYDAPISPVATSLVGYGTPSWNKNVPAKMPAYNLELTANAQPNTNTAYKVNVYVMGTDGTYPTQYTKQYDYTGTTDTTADVSSKVSGYCTDAGSSTAFSLDTNKTNVLSGNIAGDGSLVLTVYLKRAQYTLTVNKGTGINTVSGAGSYYYDAPISPAATSLAGYGTPSWDKTVPAKMPAYDLTIEASATPNTNTAYKVNVYVMDIEGKYPTQYTKQYDYTGTTDTTANISSKVSGYCTDAGSATAFSLDTNKTNVLSGNIAGDGSLVLTVYLKRAQYNLTLNKGTGIDTVTGAGTYYFDAPISPAATTLTGYNTPSWDKEVPAKMPASDLTLKASATPNTNTAYKVNVYVMDTEGKYPTQYTKQYDYTGTTDTNADVTSKVSGYCTDAGSATAFSLDTNKTNVLSGNIAGDGSLVLTVYLKRAQYTLTLNKGTGIDYVSGAGTYYYDEAISVSATELVGYGTPSWDKNVPAKMPAEDLELTASAEAKGVDYNVNVFVMGTDGTYPTNVSKTYTYNGTANTTADIADKISGYCSDAGSAVAFSLDTDKANVTSGNIEGDGSLVLTVYLKRAQYELTLNKGTGIENVTGAGPYYYDAPISPAATPLPGYNTPSWDKEVPAKMPANELTLEASATPNTNTAYKVNVFVMDTEGKYPTEYTKQYDYTGTTDTTADVTSKVSDYCTDAGSAVAFSLDTDKANVLSGNIAGDGSLVLTVYLKRAQYTLTLNKGTGIEEVSGAGTYYFDAPITISATQLPGYTSPVWDKEILTKMPATDYEITANAEVLDVNYKVNVFVMGTDGKYTEQYTKQYIYNGKAYSTADISDKITDYCKEAGSETSFTLDADKANVLTGKIAPDNSLVLNVYIKRAQYSMKYTWGNIVPEGTNLPDDIIGYYNSRYETDKSIKDLKVPKKAPDGTIEGYYIFNGWNDPNNGIIPENGGNITAIWKFEEAEYPVSFNKKDDETKKTKPETEEHNWGSKIIIDPNGGIWNHDHIPHDEVVTFIIEEPIVVEDAEKAESEFLGWERSIMSDGTVYLKAQFSQPDNPDTSDVNAIWIWTALISVTFGLGIAIIRKKKFD